MKIEELIEKIYKSKIKSVAVSIHTAKHGNKDQAGDYSTVTLEINNEKYTFSNETGAWVRK